MVSVAAGVAGSSGAGGGSDAGTGGGGSAAWDAPGVTVDGAVGDPAGPAGGGIGCSPVDNAEARCCVLSGRAVGVADRSDGEADGTAGGTAARDAGVLGAASIRAGSGSGKRDGEG